MKNVIIVSFVFEAALRSAAKTSDSVPALKMTARVSSFERAIVSPQSYLWSCEIAVAAY